MKSSRRTAEVRRQEEELSWFDECMSPIDVMMGVVQFKNVDEGMNQNNLLLEETIHSEIRRLTRSATSTSTSTVGITVKVNNINRGI